MGIWADIQKTQAVKTGALTEDVFKTFMKELEHDMKPRELIVQTGVGGMRMIQDAMQTQVYFDIMKKLNFSREERKRLGKMIKSPDPENFVIAKILIDNKLKEAKEYHK